MQCIDINLSSSVQTKQFYICIPLISQMVYVLQNPVSRHSILVPPVRSYPGMQLTSTECPNVVSAFTKSTCPLVTLNESPQSGRLTNGEKRKKHFRQSIM